MPAFFELYPAIRLELGCSDRMVDLVEEGADCAIRGGRGLADSRLIARRVGTMHYVTCASRAYLNRHGRPMHPNEPLSIHVVYPQNRHLSAKVRVFVEWIADLFSKHPTMGQ